MRTFSFDISMTDACNFRCSYCFEEGCYNPARMSQKTAEQTILAIKQFLNSDLFKTNYDILQLGFWGGEPTLNVDTMNYFISSFAEDKRVKYFIYTNGYNITPIMQTLLDYNTIDALDNTPKLFTQISYDGNPIHDNKRHHVDGSTTSKKVYDNIELLHISKIPYSIKSTITPDSFKYMFDAYMDIRDRHIKLNNTFLGHNWKNGVYFPTIDYNTLVIENFDNYYNDLRKSLLKIAKEEYNYYTQHNRFFFSWFNNNLAICSAGLHMACIDTTGEVYKCHGCLYSDNKNDHYIGTVNNVLDIVKTRQKHLNQIQILPEQCKKCYAEYCLKCNSSKYDFSKKMNYMERWTDYTVQPYLCEFYKLNTKIKHGLLKLLEEN